MPMRALLSHAALSAAVVLLAAPMAAASTRERLECVLVEQPPVLDGVLDDACWQQAPRVEGFYYPRDNTPEPERTEAWLCFDAGHIYAAIYAHDSRPDLIFAQQTQRGGGLERDDFVALRIDPRLQESGNYEFQVNAIGTQDDEIPSSGSGNLVWRGDWEAAAARVDDGFIVEMAVPYSMFVYPAGQQEIGVAFKRNFERDESDLYWPVMPDRYESERMAIVGPVPLPRPANHPAILPYAIFRAGEGDVTLQSGLDIKHVFPIGMTGLFTLNPDFRNIEDVVETIAFSDTSRFLGEPRPFFREGSGYFPGSRAFYTRRIPDVVSGVKGFGRIGDHSLGAVGTLSDRGRTDAALRYGYNITPDVGVNAGWTTTDQDGTPAASVGSLGFGGWHPLGRLSLWYGGGLNHSFRDGPGGDGNTLSVDCGFDIQNLLEAGFSYDLVDPEYDAPIGYVPESDRRGWSTWFEYGRHDQERYIQRHALNVNHSEQSREDGSLLQSSWSMGGNVRVRGGYQFGANWFTQHRPPNRDNVVGAWFEWGLESLHNNGSVSVNYGDRGGANDFFLAAEQSYAVTDRLRLGWRGEYSNRRPFDPSEPGGVRTQNVLTGTWEFDEVSSASMRMVERDGDLNLFLAYRIQPRNGRTLLVMLGDPNTNRTQGQVQVKVIWPL